jgi:hypothetical protein
MANIKTIFLGSKDFTQELDRELSIEFKKKELTIELTSFTENRIEIKIVSTDNNSNCIENSINIDLRTAIKVSKILRLEISKYMEVENG